MKILFTSHRFYPQVGGIESHSRILADFLASAGHEVVLATRSAPPPEGDGGLPFRVLRRPSAAALWQAHRWCDLVYQNNIELGALWPWFARRGPLVVTIQTWLRDSRGRRRPVDLLKKLVLRLADRVVCVSDALRRDSAHGAEVVPNTYDDRVFQILTGTPRDRAVVFLGRLVSDKGADLLLEAFSRLVLDSTVAEACNRRGIGLRLGVVGSGPEEEALRNLAAQKKLSAQVDFHGSLSGADLAAMLNRHAILAVPSQWREPFGIVALEGLACGCVPVGSDGGGLPDAIGSTGLIFPRGSVEGLQSCLKRLLCDPDLALGLLQKAPEHLAKHHPEAICKAYEKILLSAMDSRSLQTS